jgi:hypothetical protein
VRQDKQPQLPAILSIAGRVARCSGTKNKPAGRAIKHTGQPVFCLCFKSQGIGKVPNLSLNYSVGAAEAEDFVGFLVDFLAADFLAARAFGDFFAAPFLPAAFFLVDFFAVFLAAFFFAMVSGSFRCSARMHQSWSIPQGRRESGRDILRTKVLISTAVHRAVGRRIFYFSERFLWLE